MPKASKAGFYAVHVGQTPGVYTTWEDCKQQVSGYPKAQFKKFHTKAAAEAFVKVGLASGSVAAAAGASAKPQKDKNVGPLAKSTYMQRKMGASPEKEHGGEWDVVYTDGACQGNGKKGAVAGIGIWWGNNDPRNFAERCPGDQTNNRAELIAIIRALETASKDIKRLLIRTDSTYAMKCIRDWMPIWKKRKWKTADGMDVKNKAVIMFLSNLLDKRGEEAQFVKLEHVRGHAGDPGNEGADELATIGASMPELPERDWTILETERLNVVDNPAIAGIQINSADLLSPEEMRKLRF